MKGFLFASGAIWSAVFGYITVCDDMADAYEESLNDIAVRAETGPVKSVQVLAGLGCGFRLGHRVTAEASFGGQNSTINICRNRDGSGFMTVSTTVKQSLVLEAF